MLTDRQKNVLSFIENYIAQHNIPPTIKEIGEAVGLRSVSSVYSLLKKLEKKGYISMPSGRRRSIRLLRSMIVGIPIFGDIPAGEPKIPWDKVEELVPIDPKYFGGQKVFGLRVVGDSMIEAGIFDGDVAIIREQPFAQTGNIVAAILTDPEPHATLKYLYQKNGGFTLTPANPKYKEQFFTAEDIALGRVIVAGRLVGLIRKYL